MSNELVSIIIPVFNSEQYLGRCIESVILQTYNNIEIILVDDGSTDNSGLICDQYARKDNRINVIHKPNQGVSAARNDALDIIHGEYVSFIDSDDYVDTCFIEKMYSAFNDRQIKLAICGIEKIGGIDLQTGKGNMQYGNENILLPNSGYINYEELWFHSIDSNLIGCYLWNKLFKKDILDKFRLDTSLCIGEDMVYLAQYLLNIDGAYYIGQPLYKYQINETSALNATKNKSIEKIRSNMKATEKLEQITKNQTENIKNYVSYRRVRTSVWSMYKLILLNKKDRELFIYIRNTVRRNYNRYKKVKCGSKIQIITVNGLYISPEIVYILGNIFRYLFPKKMYKLSRR